MESYDQLGDRLSTRVLYQPTSSVRDSPADEHNDFAPSELTARVRRQEPVDEESSSRARMWDPVKDCKETNTTQANIPPSLPARHSNSGRAMHPTTSGFSLMSTDFPPNAHSYGQAQEAQQHPTGLDTRGAASTGLPSYYQSNDIGSNYQVNASMGLHRYPQSHAIASTHQVDASVPPQPLLVGRQYDQIQHSFRRRPGYENDPTLHPRFRDQSQQAGLSSAHPGVKGAAPTGVQLRHARNSQDHSQEYGQQYTGLESRMHDSMASRSLRQSLSPNMLQAIYLAQCGERLEENSNREEAIRAYEQACALFQDVIVESYSHDERRECNAARMTYQARLDVLLRESAARPPSPPADDPQDDDGLGEGKPQYSLDEDLALCRKTEEGLSWQEVAETDVFQGRRKHRSLSQRKHTISKMGPKYHEPEEPWTEEEDQKLCALGDAKKTLGEIHRKFRHRNAERCLDRYFQLKGTHTTGPNRTRPSHQARYDLLLFPRRPKPTAYPTITGRRPGYGPQPSTPVSAAVSHPQSIDTGGQRIPQTPATSSWSSPSPFTGRGYTAELRSSFSPYTSARAPDRSTVSTFLNSAASTEPLGTATQRWSGSFGQRQRGEDPASSSPYPSSLSSIGGPERAMSSLLAQVPRPTAPGALSSDIFGRRASQGVPGQGSAELVWGVSQNRPMMSSSSLSPTAVNSVTQPTDSTSPLSSPGTLLLPFKSLTSPGSHGVARSGIRKFRRA